jgi:hypothetical protein
MLFCCVPVKGTRNGIRSGWPFPLVAPAARRTTILALDLLRICCHDDNLAEFPCCQQKI